MTAPATEADPACPDTGSAGSSDAARPPHRLAALRCSFDTVPRATWDALSGANPWATPFASWGFHRAWWDAYGMSAQDQTLLVVDPTLPDGPPVAIVPLMHRHEVEPTDDATRSTLRHGRLRRITAVEGDCKAIFFGASYHADYATVLADPADQPAVAEAVVEHLAAASDDPGHREPWDVVDLRRLRCGDPAADALAAAFGRREAAEGWTVSLEREDVCPVVTLPEGADFDGYLATLGKKERHEIRRKLRRAEAVGEVRLEESADPQADLDAFIDLHQARWGERGLFPPTPGGDASRRFIRRLFELSGPEGPVRLSFLSVAGRRIAAGIHLETADGYLYYNAGIDPEARELSPGVLMIAAYLRRAIAEGRRRLDFLRGDEAYKYEWGAVDEPIQRLLVRRTEGG